MANAKKKEPEKGSSEKYQISSTKSQGFPPKADQVSGFSFCVSLP
jgi:hypothetical protein